MNRSLRSTVIALACVCANAHMAQWATPNNLQPVQGLYVKPSIDGTTGDLYVAASEDNGVNSQWVIEEPVNFLQPQTGYPLTYTASHSLMKSPHDEFVTNQKRSVISSPPVQYTYAVPGTTADANNAVMPCPYATAPAASPAPIAEGMPPAQYPQGYPGSYAYSPLQFLYPYLMSAAAASALKDLGISDEVANAVTSHSASSMWSPAAAYRYPWQYMMMDPNAWAQSAAAAAAAATASTLSASSVLANQTSSETTIN